MLRYFIFFLLTTLLGCTKYSKIDKWRVEFNRGAFASYTAPIGPDSEFAEWYKALEWYCKNEGWSKEECENNLKEYITEFKSILAETKDQEEQARLAKEKDLKSKGY